MLLETLSAARDFGRFHDIARVLVRFGFYDALEHLGLAGALAKAGRVLHAPRVETNAQLPSPVRLRQALEALGPTFVKLGQLLASRVDLLPPAWTSELERLQNEGPHVPWESVEAQLEAAWGVPIAEALAEIESVPMAAASIAQVHRACLRDGRQVVVKVRRPGIRETIAADLRLLERLARVLAVHYPEVACFRPTEIVRHFRASIERELDLGAECHHAERIAEALAGLPQITVPRVHWRWTSESVNVQDYLEGPPLQVLVDPEVAAARGADPAAIARTGAEAIMQMVFVDGFFHADPHGGNLLHLGGNQVGLIDFGMVGHLSATRRRQLVQLLHALVAHDAEQVAAVIDEWADVEPDADQLVDDVEAFLDRYHGVPLAHIHVGAMLEEVATLVRAHCLAFPPDLALVVKVFITLEGLGRRLDPAFDMVAAATPFVQRVRRERLAPRALAHRLNHALAEAMETLGALPRQLRRLLSATSGGRMRLHVDVGELRDFGAQVGRSANRLSISLVISALIIGSSIVMTVDGGPRLFGLPLFGFAGFIGAVSGGAWLLFSVLRSGGGR
jgi:ubiquinone biosynthesis protein